MCGIVGVIGKRPVAGLIVDALKRLEYRGYDSAGVATLIDGVIERRRAEGKLFNLEKLIDADPLPGNTGIGHTRWATHGPPTERNAHPHVTDRVAIVHNGVIENYKAIKDELEASGRRMASDTDTEVVAHLLTRLMEEGASPEEAMRKVMRRVTGAFAFAVMVRGRPDLLLCARRSCPLAIGWGEGEMFVGSDALALAPFTRRLTYLEEGDWAVVTDKGATIYDAAGRKVERPLVLTEMTGALVGKGNHRHFMEKEIFEQPEVVGYTLYRYLDPATSKVVLPDLPFDLAAVPRITIIAAGTSYLAALVAKYWLERVARVPVEVDIASEFRYREADMPAGGVAVFISQSGETLDTLMALRYARKQRQHIVAIVNVPESSIARESDVVLPTLAGPEICVASTKGLTTQLAVLACLTLAAADARKALPAARRRRLAKALGEIPSRIAEALDAHELLLPVAHAIAQARDVLYLGRGTNYPLALEGALKLKELSYIHAEGYAAGEMKHGPIALIDEHVPVVVVAPTDEMFDKTAANVTEVIARGGKVVLLGDKDGIDRLGTTVPWAVRMPDVDPFVAPIVYAVPVQLLAYYTAVEKGTDVDQPRNLAKSVTVE